MFRFTPLLCLLSACADDAIGPVLSPVDGSVITSPVIPLIVTMHGGGEATKKRAFLDGKNVSDPNTVSREVYGFLGGERHFLSTLDLSDVDPGEHTLRVVTGPWPNHSEIKTTFTLAPPQATVQVTLSDEAGEPISGRVYVLDENGPVELASAGTEVDHNQRDLNQSTIVCDGGTGMVWLAPGEYTLIGWRGLTGDVDVQEVTVQPGDNLVSFVVPTAVLTPGEVSSDLHVHTGKSIDSWVPDDIRFAALNTVGLDIYVITEHNHVTDAPGRATASNMDAPAQAVTGSEVDLRIKRPDEEGFAAAGHINVFPLKPDVVLPDYHKDSMAEILADHYDIEGRHTLEEADDRLIVQLNHPRGIHFHPSDAPEPVWQVFDYLGFDRTLPPGEGANAWLLDEHDGVNALDFQVLEVVNRFSLPLYREVRADWFHLLDEGYYRTASGNSDTHGLTIEMAGMTVTMVEADHNDDGTVHLNSWVDSLEAGRARVSTGPFVSITAGGASPGSTLESGGLTEVQVRVQAASWVPLEEVRIVERSSTVWTSPIAPEDRGSDGRLDKTWTVSLDLGTEDGWLLAEAGYPISYLPSDPELGLYADIAPGYVPLGFTNAIRVDADGTPGWTPQPRLGPVTARSLRPSGN